MASGDCDAAIPGAVQVALAQSYGCRPSLAKAHVGAVTGCREPVVVSVVPSVVVLSGASLSRQVTSVAAEPPGRSTRPPSLTAVAETPWGNS